MHERVRSILMRAAQACEDERELMSVDQLLMSLLMVKRAQTLMKV